MSAPIYFFSGLPLSELVHENRLNRKTLDRYGLLDQFGDVRSVEAELSCWDLTTIGPDCKTSGVIMQAYTLQPDGGRLAGKRCGFFPEFQNWHHVLDANETQLWLGVDKEQPVGPEDLRRRRMVSGYPVEMLDGREWHIPVIRTPWDTTRMPAAMTYDEHGKYCEPLLAEYQSAFDAFGEVVNWFMQGQFLISHRPRALDLNALALGINYRYGKHEAKVLRLVSTENYLDALGAAIDWPKVVELGAEKKVRETQPESNTSPGRPEEIPTTNQAGET